MGQHTSTAYSFCCTTCTACPCCTSSDYDKLDKLGLMNNSQSTNYQSNGTYSNDNNIIKSEEIQTETQTQTQTTHSSDERTQFRAFVIAYNKSYGYLLLRAYKKGKGLHYQLPGGHIDKSELHASSFENAAKYAAKRELYEETGININDNTRLKLLKLGVDKRVYFQLLLQDSDSLSNENIQSLNNTQDFYLKLSAEHNAFIFEKDINKAIEMIQKHSSGMNSQALSLYAQKAKHERKRSRSHSNSHSHSMDKLKKKKEKKKKHRHKHKNKQKKKDISISVENNNPFKSVQSQVQVT